MQVVKYPLLGPSYKTKSTEQSIRHLVNMYLSQDPTSGDYPIVGYCTPGAKVWSSSITATEVRGLFFQNDVLYAVIGNKFYSFTQYGVATERGTLLTSTGICDIEATNLEIMINDGTYGYTYIISSTSFARITDSDFYAGTNTITSQDSYFIAHQNQSFQISNSLDGRTWDGLDFASAEGDPDNLISIKSFKRRLFLCGTQSTEVWFNTGDTFPFARIEGIFIEYGCAAKKSMATSSSQIFWLGRGKKGQLTILGVDESLIDKPVASEALAQELNTYSKVDDAIAFVYQRENKEFYQITFPTVNKTWLYDITLDAWYELTSTVAGSQGRHLANCCTQAFGKILIGDYKSGTIYELDSNTFTDNSETIIRKIVTSPLMSDSKVIRLQRLEVDIQNNVGLSSGQGSDPVIMLRVSKDSGFTWGNVVSRNVGSLGNYKQRALFGPLGSNTRKPVFEITMSDPVNWVVLGAWLYASTGKN